MPPLHGENLNIFLLVCLNIGVLVSISVRFGKVKLKGFLFESERRNN